jgi:hypothetical protein
MMKTPSNALRPAPEGELPPTLLIDNQDALLNEPVYKVNMHPSFQDQVQLCVQTRAYSNAFM